MVETTLLSSSPRLQYTCHSSPRTIDGIEVCVAVGTVKDLGRF